MGQASVCALGQIHSHGQARGVCRRRDMVDDRFGTIGSAELCRIGVQDWSSRVEWGTRIQLKRAIVDLDDGRGVPSP